jgi:hypothetical protein
VLESLLLSQSHLGFLRRQQSSAQSSGQFRAEIERLSLGLLEVVLQFSTLSFVVNSQSASNGASDVLTA